MFQLDDLTRRTIAAEMERLRNHVDYVCNCELKPANVPGAINWGDLGCVAAAFSINSNGDVFQTVYVEEAAPDNDALQMAIRAACLRDGWGDVEVITAW